MNATETTFFINEMGCSYLLHKKLNNISCDKPRFGG